MSEPLNVRTIEGSMHERVVSATSFPGSLILAIGGASVAMLVLVKVIIPVGYIPLFFRTGLHLTP